VRWTEADVLAAQGDLDRACRVLREAAERDRRGAHKALIRLARVEFRRHNYEQALKAARQAGEFFQSHYRNAYFDGLFWEAAALVRLARHGEAQARVAELERLQPDYPNLGKLKQLLEANLPEPGGD
jgi:tetratricopeptide (TPR) repeat protein